MDKFDHMCGILLDVLHPDDIIGKLVSANMLSHNDIGEIDSLHPRIEQVKKLLDTVRRAILADTVNRYSAFLNILESVPKYKPIVSRIKGGLF